MTEEVQTQEAQAQAEAPAKVSNLPKRVAAVLTLKSDAGEWKVAKYPMPVKAPRFELSINGEMVQAAATAFKDKHYTYFQYNGVDFYVAGQLSQEPNYIFQFPEGYEFKPLKMDRQAQANAAAAKAKAKKAATPGAEQASGSEESAPAASETASEGSGSSAVSDAPTAPESEAPKKGKKASR